MKNRCSWCGDDALYVDYHDREWGVPVHDPRALWEMLVLEGFQAGLSWITILRKREAFRRAFAGFDPVRIATWGEADVRRLLEDPGIVRHKGKIEATITNARAYLHLQQTTPFNDYAWGFVDGAPMMNRFTEAGQVPAKTDLSTAISKDLKARGFRFCGPTTVYAWMQASGLVNDHMVDCFRHRELDPYGT